MSPNNLPVLFVDDGGVLNDNVVRGANWGPLAGEFLAREVGGDPKTWALANRRLLDDGHFDVFVDAPLSNYDRFHRKLWVDWVHGMFRNAGLVPPPDDDVAFALHGSVIDYVTPRTDSGIPGSARAIRELHGAGFTLHTASGETSRELHGYLTGMGIRDRFSTLYGPDLVDCAKLTSRYHELVFADAGVEPADAIVFDDSEIVLEWAREAGAEGIHVTPERPLAVAASEVIARYRRG